MPTNGEIAQREEHTAHALGILLPCRELELDLAALERRQIEPEIVGHMRRMVLEIRRHGEWVREKAETMKADQ